MSITIPRSPTGTFRSIITTPRCIHRLRWLVLLLVVLSFAQALPTNVTPVGNNIDLDVGQKNKVSKQNWALGVVLITVGLLEVFYGFKFIRLTLLVIGFLSWAATAMILMLIFKWDLIYEMFKPQHYAFWVWIIAGLIGATISFRFWDLGVTFTGAFGGFALAMGIIAAANLSIGNVARYVILALMLLGGAAIATFFDRIFIICGSSYGGAYVFMFGVDQFAQVGYREMIVIFDFRGKTLTYHPNLQVYLMLGSSLVLAGLGIAWEFWHHSRPILMDREAVFRIYGRPFGKRPKKLVGEKIHQHLKRRFNLYLFLTESLKRRTIQQVLDEECCYPETDHTAPPEGEQPSTTPPDVQTPETKEPKTTIPPDSSGAPFKSTPVADSGEKHANPSDNALSEVVIDGSHPEGTVDHTEQQQDSEEIHNTPSTSADSKEDSTEPIVEIVDAGPSSPTTHPTTRPSPPEPHHHPLFSPNLGARTVQLIRLVSDDISPGNTIPREFLENSHMHPGVYRSGSIWPISSSSSSEDARSTSSLLPSHGLQMLEVSESDEDSDEVENGEESAQDEDTSPRPVIVFHEQVEK
ncbi:hypothetical protein BGX34_006277 [Mortierella sp. NVP85]|nr:hypothetical protein BGX34_006277 [Mortierella sp. NVP85]